MATRLTGEAIGTRTAPSRLVGRFLFRVGELAKGIAVQVAGTLGQRGPIRAGSVGELGVTRLLYAQSVDLGFGVAGAEQLSLLGPDAPPMQRAAETIAELAELQDEEVLLSRARELGERVASDYIELLDLVLTERIAVGVRTASRAAYLSPQKARWARAVLDKPGSSVSEEFHVIGTLYEAEAINRGFRLDPEEAGARKVQGTFPETLREKVREAWGRKVIAHVLRTETTLARSAQPKVQWELLDLEVIGNERNGGDRAE